MPAASQPASLAAEGESASSRRVVISMLLLGALLFITNLDAAAHWRYVIAMAAAGLASIPKVNLQLVRLINRLHRPSTAQKWLTAAILFVLSARYFLFSASFAGRALIPTFHDESMYLLQAQMLSHGHLWMPQHELADFFDSFFVTVRPVYAATYFPGTALLYVPGIWLKLAPWATSITIAALVVVLFYIIFTEVLDGVSGLLAALLIISLKEFRVISVMTMSHPAVLLLVLTAIWIYLQWRNTHQLRWALLFGAASGWAAITRPLDAACLLAPIGLAMLYQIRRQTIKEPDARPPLSKSRLVAPILAILLGASPFLGLQLVFDKALTGHFLQTPIAQYGQVNFPGLFTGIHEGIADTHSTAALPQVRDYYTQFVRPALVEHSHRSLISTWLSDRFLPMMDASLPVHLLLVLIPVGLLAIRRPDRIAIVAGGFLVTVGYAMFPIYLRHYALMAYPAFILLALLGQRVLGQTFPAIGSALAVAIFALAIASLPELRGEHDPFMEARYLVDVNAKLSQLDHLPAVVLFHYESNRADVHEEPVYNLDAAWPDNAQVIRAQDLGDRNRRIFSYYAHHGPSRFFYRYDRTTGLLTELGWAKDLSEGN
jgi:hypothetical protein